MSLGKCWTCVGGSIIRKIMSGLDKVRKNRDRILEIAALHGAADLRIFGSVVRHEDRPDSDVDFLVKMAPEHDLLDIIALSRELEELLQQKSDVISDEELSPYMRDRILQEAVAV